MVDWAEVGGGGWRTLCAWTLFCNGRINSLNPLGAIFQQLSKNSGGASWGVSWGGGGGGITLQKFRTAEYNLSPVRIAE